jgi:hypothetical protein
MKNKKVIFTIASLVLVSSLLFGCTKKVDTTPDDMTNMTAAPVASVSSVPATTSENDSKYTLDSTFVQDGNKVTITWKTNIKVSAEHYGGAPVAGEGHAHVNLDGKKITGLKDDKVPYVLANIAKGKHTISVDLHKNNHDSYNVPAKTLDIEVK